MNIDEQNIIWKGSPHISSFMGFYSLLVYGILILLFGQIYLDFHKYNSDLISTINDYVLWNFLISLPLIIMTFKLVQVRWVIFYLIYISFMLLLENKDIENAPQISLMIMLIVFWVWIEFHRKAYQFIITKHSIVIKFHGFKTWERVIPIDKITDLILEQNFVGKIFNIGSIIPISSSGLGLGNDAVMGGLSANLSPIRKVSGGILLGNIRSQNRPRSEKQFILFGIKNPKEIQHKISKLV